MKYYTVNVTNHGRYLGMEGPLYGVTVSEELYKLMCFIGLDVHIVPETKKDILPEKDYVKTEPIIKEEEVKVDKEHTKSQEQTEPKVITSEPVKRKVGRPRKVQTTNIADLEKKYQENNTRVE